MNESAKYQRVNVSPDVAQLLLQLQLTILRRTGRRPPTTELVASAVELFARRYFNEQGEDACSPSPRSPD